MSSATASVDGQERMAERDGQRLCNLMGVLAVIVLPRLEEERRQLCEGRYTPLTWNAQGVVYNAPEE